MTGADRVADAGGAGRCAAGSVARCTVGVDDGVNDCEGDADEAGADDTAGGGAAAGAVRVADGSLGGTAATLRSAPRCVGDVVKRPATGFLADRAAAGAGRAGRGVYVP